MPRPRIFIGNFYLGTRQQRGEGKWVGWDLGFKTQKTYLLRTDPLGKEENRHL